MILSFELTMPNRGSWNGQWTGQDNKYWIVKNISNKYLNSKDYFKTLLKQKYDNFHYSFGDGWSANVRIEIIESGEAKRRRKQTAGFCSYEWMIDSILFHGEIQNTNYWKKQKELESIQI